MVENIDKRKLIQQLKGQIDRLERFDATPESVCGALLIIIHSYGYLEKVEEHYIKKF